MDWVMSNKSYQLPEQIATQKLQIGNDSWTILTAKPCWDLLTVTVSSEHAKTDNNKQKQISEMVWLIFIISSMVFFLFFCLFCFVFQIYKTIYIMLGVKFAEDIFSFVGILSHSKCFECPTCNGKRTRPANEIGNIIVIVCVVFKWFPNLVS